MLYFHITTLMKCWHFNHYMALKAQIQISYIVSLSVAEAQEQQQQHRCFGQQVHFFFFLNADASDASPLRLASELRDHRGGELIFS